MNESTKKEIGTKMIFLVLLLLMLISSKAELAERNCFFGDYLEKDSANVVKGIFVFLILLSHGKGYIAIGGVYDDPYIALQNHLHQMVVVMFFFYSGYGMMEQVKAKEYAYCLTIPKKRFPQLLLHFDLAVLLFYILKLIMGKPVTWRALVMALLSWGSIGNSNWYIFVLLVLYVIFFVAFFPIKWLPVQKAMPLGAAILTGCSVVFVYVLMRIEMGHWWWDTLILFSAGVWYSLYRTHIEQLIMRDDLLFSLAVSLVFALYFYSFSKRWTSVEWYTVWAACFTALILMFTMKVKLKSGVLRWMGEHIFGIFILQRIPFIVFSSMDFFQKRIHLFFLASFVATVFLTLVFERCTEVLDKRIWKSRSDPANTKQMNPV